MIAQHQRAQPARTVFSFTRPEWVVPLRGLRDQITALTEQASRSGGTPAHAVPDLTTNLTTLRETTRHKPASWTPSAVAFLVVAEQVSSSPRRDLGHPQKRFGHAGRVMPVGGQLPHRR